MWGDFMEEVNWRQVLKDGLNLLNDPGLVAQSVKNLPAVQKTWVQSLGWGDTLEKEMATRSSIFTWEILLIEGAWWAIVHGVPKLLDTT